LHAEEQAALASLKTIDGSKKQLATLGTAANERHKHFAEYLEKHFKLGSVNTAIIDYLDILKCFYFSSYDRMSG
jgi:hypothetical protein